MKRTNRFVLIGLVLLLELTFSIVNIRGYEDSVGIKADSDAYVDSGNQYDNFGVGDSVESGVGLFGNYEAYFHFKIPSNFTSTPNRVEISLCVLFVLQKTEFSIVLVEEEWDEEKINWKNKPQHGKKIMTFMVKEEGVLKIDISDYTKERDEISICIKAADMDDSGSISLYSIEGYESDDDAPQLIWTYEELDWGFLIFCILMISGMIGVIILLLKKSAKKGEQSLQPKPIDDEVFEIENNHIQVIENCPYCEARIHTSSRTCEYCGHNLT